MNTRWLTRKRSLLLGATVLLATAAIVAAVIASSGDSKASDDAGRSDSDLSVVESGGAAQPDASSSHASSGSPEDASDTNAGLAAMPDPQPDETSTTTAAPLDEVPARTMEVRDPIALDATGDFGTGVTVDLVSIDPVEGEARLPGEIAGPALRVEVRITNNSSEAISLGSAQVEVTYGPDRIPGMLLGQPDVVAFPESVGPGETAVAATVFGVPLEQREQIQVVVMYGVEAPIVVFEGSAR